MTAIDEWWPRLDEQIRRWFVNNLWSPIASFSIGEIARLGGPGPDDRIGMFKTGSSTSQATWSDGWRRIPILGGSLCRRNLI